MGENTVDYREKIEVLETESRKLDQGIDKARRQKSQLDKLQSELKRQIGIKNLVKELEQKRKLIADKIPAAATLLDYRKESMASRMVQMQEEKTQTQNRTVPNNSASAAITNPINIATIVISIIVMICSFGAWLSVAGMDIDLLNMMKGLNTLSSWGVGGYVDQSRGMLWLLIIGIWIVGLNAAWIAFQALRGRSFRGNAIGGTVWSVFMVVILLILSKYVASQTSGWVSIQINMKAYVTVILSIVVTALAFSKKDENEAERITPPGAKVTTKSMSTSVAGGTESEYAITNAYPWMNLQLVSGILKQKERTTVNISYKYNGYPVDGINAEKFGSCVRLLTDIVFATTDDTYAVKDAELLIASLQKEGNTETIHVQTVIGQVISLQVFVKEMLVDNQTRVPMHGFHVEVAEV